MRVRHKIPNVFSLSMMDVLCCALGCVILLWLLGGKQNDDETSELREKVASAGADGARELVDANSKLLVERDRVVALEAQLAQRILDAGQLREVMKSEVKVSEAKARELAGKLKKSLDHATDLEAELKAGRESLESERKKSKIQDRKLTDAEASLKVTRADLDSAKKNSATTRRQLDDLEAEVKAGRDSLEAERKKSKTLDKKLSDAEASLKATRADLDVAKKNSATTQRQLDDLEREVASKKGELKKMTQSLADAEAARKKLAGTLEVRDKEVTDARKRERDAETQLRERTAALAEAKLALGTLKKEADALRTAAREKEKDRDRQFAGITLTGKRVVFLVDVSGSMVLVAPKQKAPQKWPEVCETVGRLMRSLESLEKYQVICFARKVTYPLGREGKWHDFDPKESPDQAVKALRKVEPEGGTEMYPGMEATFAFRATGLDAVYLLSDGLPSYGPGLTKKQDEELNELDRGLLLGQYIRKKLKDDWNKPDRKEQRVKINTIGFFYESPDLGSFLWALARENDGSFVGMSKP